MNKQSATGYYNSKINQNCEIKFVKIKLERA